MVLIAWSHNILSTGPLINLHSEHTAGDFGAINLFFFLNIYTSSYTVLKNRKISIFKTVFNLMFPYMWGKKCYRYKIVTHWCERRVRADNWSCSGTHLQSVQHHLSRTILWQAKNWTFFLIFQHRRGFPWSHPHTRSKGTVSQCCHWSWFSSVVMHSSLTHCALPDSSAKSLQVPQSQLLRETEPAVVFQTLTKTHGNGPLCDTYAQKPFNWAE